MSETPRDSYQNHPVRALSIKTDSGFTETRG